jgi:hypothetical protein
MTKPVATMSTDPLHTPMSWTRTADAEFPFSATDAEGATLRIRLNDFPVQPMYTLLVDAVPLASFDDWPPAWNIRATD